MQPNCIHFKFSHLSGINSHVHWGTHPKYFTSISIIKFDWNLHPAQFQLCLTSSTYCYLSAQLKENIVCFLAMCQSCGQASTDALTSFIPKLFNSFESNSSSFSNRELAKIGFCSFQILQSIHQYFVLTFLFTLKSIFFLSFKSFSFFFSSSSSSSDIHFFLLIFPLIVLMI